MSNADIKRYIEELKGLSEVRLPDERQVYRGLTLESLHEFASRLSLNPTVPDLVQNQFAIARHAIIYSYFFYPFDSAAEMYGLLAVELALSWRARITDPVLANRERLPGLSQLLRTAVRDRWLLDTGFSHVPKDLGVSEHVLEEFRSIPNDQHYCRALIERLPHERNHLAHGIYVLKPGPSPTLVRDAELINQLYPSPSP